MNDELREAINAAADEWARNPGVTDSVADAILALPEIAALRAKADAADRVRELADEITLAHAEAKAAARANRDSILRNQYIGRAWGLGDALTDLRRALDGDQS